MAYFFADSFDPYATTSEPLQGYWDGGLISNTTLAAGRFGGQAINWGNSSTNSLVKNSGQNDSVHHIIVAFRQTILALGGTTLGNFFQLSDGATAQCSIVFRSDGAMLLTSGTAAGTTLATYTGAVTALNVWYAFEIEVVIHPTAGSFTVRKNGNTSNDFTATGLNTRPGTNTYANRLTLGQQTNVNAHQIDDVIWRSDASSVPFVGDVRAYVRMPASDASAQFTKSTSPYVYNMGPQFSASSSTAGIANYSPFTPLIGGTLTSITMVLTAAYTGNIKCSIFSDIGGFPGAVIASATPIVNGVIGNNTMVFPTPPTLVKGVQYWWGRNQDATINYGYVNLTTGRVGSVMPYASFPVASPAVGGLTAPLAATLNITPAFNADYVNEIIQDGSTSYVYDSTTGHADFYALAALSSTPASTIAVTTRGLFQKSDAGTRSAAVQLKSGATTVNSGSVALPSSWLWLWRTDTTDPATGAAWTAAAVNAATIGPIVTV